MIQTQHFEVTIKADSEESARRIASYTSPEEYKEDEYVEWEVYDIYEKVKAK
jgi:hypothetical protein